MAIANADPQIKFQRYLVRNLHHLINLVITATPLPDEETRIQAMHTLSYALRLPDLWTLTRQLVITLAPKMEQAGHRTDWLIYLEAATTLSEQQADWSTTAECYLQRGLLHRLLSEFRLAIEYLQQSITLWQRLDAKREQARGLNELAWVAYLQNQTAAATAYVEQALALLPVDDPERAMCYRVQGMIAIAHERWTEAETWHRQALAIFETQGEQRKTAWSLQNLAYALRGQARFAEAIGHYEQAAALLQTVGDLYHWSTVQMNLGLTCHHSGNSELAICYYAAARSVPISVIDMFHRARLSLNTAVALMTLARFPEAEGAFLEAIKFHTEIGATAWRLNDMDGLAMTYIGWGKFLQAIHVLEQALEELPTIVDAPNYSYLSNSLHQHWEEAHQNLRNSG